MARELAEHTGMPKVTPLTIDQLRELAPTQDNVSLMLHRLWGQAADGDYRKREWSVFADLLQRFAKRVA